jgi:hypothetical protein
MEKQSPPLLPEDRHDVPSIAVISDLLPRPSTRLLPAHATPMVIADQV